MPTERQVKQHAESKLFVPSSESQGMELWLSGASSKTQQILDAFATLITKVTRATAARILLNASLALTGSIQISDSPGNRGFHLGAHYGARMPAIPIPASQKREYQANSDLAGYPYRECAPSGHASTLARYCIAKTNVRFRPKVPHRMCKRRGGQGCPRATGRCIPEPPIGSNFSCILR